MPLRPIDYPIEAQTHPAHYLMHKYWARKPHNLVNAYIKHFTGPGDLVLDPFMGSGVTVIEALKLKRRVCGVDINPVAHFIATNTIVPVSLSELQENYTLLSGHIAPVINKFYSTICIHCGKPAIAVSYQWFNGEPREVSYKCSCSSGRKSLTKAFSTADQELLEATERDFAELVNVYDILLPTGELPQNSQINAPGYRVIDLFTRRNLLVLAILKKYIEEIVSEDVRELMRFIFSASLVQASKMILHARGQGPGWKVMGYWVPLDKGSQELNVWHYFSNKYKRVLRGKTETNKLISSTDYCLLQQSSSDLPQLADNSVDYIFTDPPYGGSVPYLEMSALWAAWLGFSLNYREEIVVSKNETYNKSLENYRQMLLAAFSEIYKKLKNGSYMSITFHNKDLRTWRALLYSVREAGFTMVNLVHQPQAKLSSSQGLYHKKRITGDFILNFIKSPSKNIFKPAGLNFEATVLSKTRELLTGQKKVTTDLVYRELVPLFANTGLLDEEEVLQKNLEQILNKHFEQVREIEQTGNRGKELEVYTWK
ncbi:adenine-specific DNA methylase [Desulfofarcimen acetoxidans DSM 771]|uniref:Adenine-specific DNA methylase n=1 Tax=Desulfofarcimen acetoxidans (strain ATCC 49208 / DSM 771 / KCTC 5769 / VKM B-1644 / 5575) TaxID=485916 RepID=C8W6H3_DESAS|nr:DNA methyltransferase [Desulfofarcimen acetoxidans]ACV62262.1 adenine-specific DNA methylase [Desulfofarcimen acetoxidans DSM 771]